MRCAFFDLDDTLYERCVPFVRAFREFFGDAYPEETARAAYKTCNVRGQEVFGDSQTGKMSMRDMYIYRYTLGLRDVGIAIGDEEALEIQRLYKKYQGMLEMTPVMRAVLETAIRRFDAVCLLTNGPGEHQRAKAKCLGIDRLIPADRVFISGELGAFKPDPRIFEHAAKTVGVDPENAWMIGDSFETDIAGANRMGWNTVYYNKNRAPIPAGEQAPDFMAADENELLQLINQL